MPTVEHEILLRGPQEQVWERIIRLRDLPLWLDGVASVRAISTAQTQPGTRFEIVRIRPPTVEYWIVLDWNPPRSLRLTEYHQDRHFRFVLEPLAAETMLRARYEWRGSTGLFPRLRTGSAQRKSLELSLQRLGALINCSSTK